MYTLYYSTSYDQNGGEMEKTYFDRLIPSHLIVLQWDKKEP